MKDKAFILKNETQVNIISTRILLISCLLVFPLLILLNYIKVFNINWSSLIIFSVCGISLAFIPSIIRYFNPNSTIVKYLSVVVSTIVIGMLATNPAIGIYLIYLFPVALSCLYFDRKLTFTAFLIGIPNLAISQYLRIATKYSSHPADIMSAYIAYLAGFTLEFLALSLIFIMLTKRTRALLENLVGSEEQSAILKKLKEVMEKSTHASNTLANSVSQLSASMEETTENNKLIASNTSEVAKGSAKNLNYIEDTHSTIQNITSSLQGISDQSNELVTISQGTYNAAVTSMEIIQHAIESMKIIEASSQENKNMMNRLGNTSEQIGNIVEIISNLTKQTNLLALNAAIESARAGEHGKGFAVVAEQIRKLAEQSASSANDISNLVNNIQNDTKNAIKSIDEGADAVRTGIDQVRTAGTSFEELKVLQEQSNGKVQVISTACKEVYSYGNKIADLITNVKTLTEDLLGNLESIAASTDSQASAMDEIVASFEEVDRIAEDLLILSKTNDIHLS